MASILGTLTLILLIAGGFISLKNNVRFQKEISDKEIILKDFQQNQKKLEEIQKEPNSLEEQIQSLTTDIQKKQSEVSTYKKGISESQKNIESNSKEFAKTKAQLDGLKKLIHQIGGMAKMNQTIRNLKNEIDTTTADVAASESNLASIQVRDARLNESVKKRSKNLEFLASGVSLPSLRTSVRSSYDTWGFVTLNSGNKAGVISKSTLEVVRDGQTIARLLVHTVEENSASATVIPDSLVEGFRVEMGDTVVASNSLSTNVTVP